MNCLYRLWILRSACAVHPSSGAMNDSSARIPSPHLHPISSPLTKTPNSASTVRREETSIQCRGAWRNLGCGGQPEVIGATCQTHIRSRYDSTGPHMSMHSRADIFGGKALQLDCFWAFTYLYLILLFVLAQPMRVPARCG